MRAERVTAPRRFVVTVDYEWTGVQDIEVELTPDRFRWRFAGEKRFREATWNHIPATLDAMLESRAGLEAFARRIRQRAPRRRQAAPGQAIEGPDGMTD
jgi:hypothetical protein